MGLASVTEEDEVEGDVEMTGEGVPCVTYLTNCSIKILKDLTNYSIETTALDFVSLLCFTRY